MVKAGSYSCGPEELFEGMSRRKISTYAAAGAYYLFMSLVPMVHASLRRSAVNAADGRCGYGRAFRICARVHVCGGFQASWPRLYSGGGAALTVSIVLTIWSASKSMKAMMRGMDAAYTPTERKAILFFSLRAAFICSSLWSFSCCLSP